MPGIGDVFGSGSIGEQLFVWGVLQQLIYSLVQPASTELVSFVNTEAPVQPLSPPTVADMVARGLKSDVDGINEAVKSGISQSRFEQLVTAARNAPDLSLIIAGIQRGLITWGSDTSTGTAGDAALKEGRLDPKWYGLIHALATNIPSTQQVMNALLEGQISRDEAETRYKQAGGDMSWFQADYDSNGQAPTPVEALTLLNRGIIPESGTGPDSVSYEQAFLEGPWRNKWLQPFRALGAYLPPPRTVTAMLKNGSLTTAQATDLLVKQGLTAELAAAYVHDAEQQAAAGSKDLTQTAVISLYEAQLISNSDASGMLVVLGYSQDNASLLLAMADLRRVISALNAGISRVQALYVGHKIDRNTAVNTLNSLGVPPAQVDGIVSEWDITAAVNVKTLTEAQIVAAWYYQVISQDTATAELVNIGYTPLDAWILLSTRNKAPLPNQPAAGPAAP